jgi:hypothetical protein
MTGDVPSSVGKPDDSFLMKKPSMIVIGGGAVQITNQERLYHLMQTEQKTDNK